MISTATTTEISPIGEFPPTERPMTEAEARECIASIRGSVAHVRLRLFDLHRLRGWEALGYSSFRKCIAAEFPQSESYLYRQLSAAEIEAEISPIGEIGSIPEAQLRPLASLPPGDRKPAFDLAKEAAPSGKMTARVVEETVKAVDPKPVRPGRNSPIGETDARRPAPRFVPEQAEDSPIGEIADDPGDEFPIDEPPSAPAGGKSRVNGVHADDPADVAKLRASGRIAPGVVVEVVEPTREPGEDDAEPMGLPAHEPDDDAEWLATLPARSKIAPGCVPTFDADALIFRRLEPARKTYSHHATRILNASRRKGPYAYRVSRFLKTAHPRHWIVCPALDAGGCGGTGQVDLIGECPKCRGKGYWING